MNFKIIESDEKSLIKLGIDLELLLNMLFSDNYDDVNYAATILEENTTWLGKFIRKRCKSCFVYDKITFEYGRYFYLDHRVIRKINDLNRKIKYVKHINEKTANTANNK